MIVERAERTLRRLAWVAPALVAVVLSSCTSVYPAPSPRAGAGRVTSGPLVRRQVSGLPLPAAERVDIWLIADPLHSGVVFPLDWLEDSGFVVPRVVRGAKYVTLSWGDRVAYEQERWLTVSEVVQALLLPSESVVEIIVVDYDPRWVFPGQRIYHATIPVSSGPAVADFLNHAIKPGPGGAGVEVIGKATWGKGNLLGCPHNYQFPRLCNSFTAGALTSCGYEFGFWGRVTANSLIRSCVRQGFELVPPLTPAQQQALASYLESGEVSADAP